MGGLEGGRWESGVYRGTGFVEVLVAYFACIALACSGRRFYDSIFKVRVYLKRSRDLGLNIIHFLSAENACVIMWAVYTREQLLSSSWRGLF